MLPQFPKGIGAGHIQQSEPWLDATDISDDQRFGYQIGQAVHRTDARCIHRNRCSGLHGKIAREDAQCTKEALLGLAKQPVAPVHNSLHRLVPRLGSTAPWSHQPQALVKAGRKAFNSEHLDARRGKFDRQWQAVQFPADPNDQRGVSIGQNEVLDDRCYSVDEKLRGRKSCSLRCCQLRRKLGAAEGFQSVHPFAGYSQRFPAGRQNGKARRAAEYRDRQVCRRANDMLAGVEQQQHTVVSKGSDEAGKRILGARFQAEHAGNRARYQAIVVERRQIDQPDTVLISIDHPFGGGEGHGGLSDAAGPDDRDEALLRQLRNHRCLALFAADHACCSKGQIVRRCRRGRWRRGLRWLLTTHGGDETVASSWNGDDVAMAAMAVAEGAAQSAHLNLQVRFFDVCLRPGSGDQLLLADYLSGTLDQRGKNVEGAAAEPHLPVALKQKPLLRVERERTKRDDAFVHKDAFGWDPFQVFLPNLTGRGTFAVPK